MASGGRSGTPNSTGGGEGCSTPGALSRTGSAGSLPRSSSRTSRRQLNGSQITLATNELTCPVCLELLDEPHITRCGHTFCYRCIFKSFESNGRCPTCGVSITAMDQLIPNFVLSDLVAKHRAQTNEIEAVVTGDLRGLVTAESSRLTLPDVNAVLELLTQRKQALEAESSTAQNKLLHEFLRHLLQNREEQLERISKEVNLVRKDISYVESSLKQDSNTISDCSALSTRRKRMHAHFDDFVQCYFQTRGQHLFFGAEESAEQVEDGLTEFRDNLTKFSRYSAFRATATLNYSTGAPIPSTIVSSIEFDKDDELFAIAGVTKRIKIFDYGAILRDAVDIHYPCVEMACSNKISCISWNAYHKTTLASSDYGGAVTIWDISNGTRTKIFQEHEKRCWSIDFNQVDTRLIASGSDDAKVKLWSLNSEHSIATLEAKANVCCVKFNPFSSCHLAFGSADHCVHYYDLRQTKEPLALFKGHRKAVSYVKFLNQDELVSASTDSQLKSWSLSKKPRQCMRTFVGHTNEKNFVGLATDGDYIVCGSENNSIFAYYKGLSKQLFSFKFDPHPLAKDDDVIGDFVSAVCWKRNSNVVLAANSLGVIKLLELI